MHNYITFNKIFCNYKYIYIIQTISGKLYNLFFISYVVYIILTMRIKMKVSFFVQYLDLITINENRIVFVRNVYKGCHWLQITKW